MSLASGININRCHIIYNCRHGVLTMHSGINLAEIRCYFHGELIDNYHYSCDNVGACCDCEEQGIKYIEKIPNLESKETLSIEEDLEIFKKIFNLFNYDGTYNDVEYIIINGSYVYKARTISDQYLQVTNKVAW